MCLFLLTKATYANNFYNVEYIKNYDGDTITFDLGYLCSHDIFCKNISIRVDGVDTPEIKTRRLKRTRVRIGNTRSSTPSPK